MQEQDLKIEFSAKIVERFLCIICITKSATGKMLLYLRVRLKVKVLLDNVVNYSMLKFGSNTDFYCLSYQSDEIIPVSQDI